MGKRTMMVYDKGTCLLVEGLGFEIVDDSTWKKPEEVQKEIGSHYLKFYNEQGCEPHYAECTIRWCDTLETEEVRIALAMDSDNEKDDEIFFYCDSLEDLKSLADKGKEPDVPVSGYTKNCYKQLKNIRHENQMSGTLREYRQVCEKHR